MCMGGCEMISSWNLQHGAVSEWASIQVNQNPISHPPHFESERSKQNYEEELQSLSWTRFNFLFFHFQDSGGKEKRLFFFPSLKNKKRVQNRQKIKTQIVCPNNQTPPSGLCLWSNSGGGGGGWIETWPSPLRYIFSFKGIFRLLAVWPGGAIAGHQSALPHRPEQTHFIGFSPPPLLSLPHLPLFTAGHFTFNCLFKLRIAMQHGQLICCQECGYVWVCV